MIHEVIDKDMIISLLRFLENPYYESKIYFCVKRVIGDGYIEIFNDKAVGKGWFIGVKGGAVRVEFPAKRVLAELETLGGDFVLFSDKVVQRSLNIASYAYSKAQEVSDILGEQAILDNIAAHKAFGEQLTDLIKKTLGVEEKPKLRLIKEEKE